MKHGTVVTNKAGHSSKDIKHETFLSHTTTLHAIYTRYFLAGPTSGTERIPNCRTTGHAGCYICKNASPNKSDMLDNVL